MTQLPALCSNRPPLHWPGFARLATLARKVSVTTLSVAGALGGCSGEDRKVVSPVVYERPRQASNADVSPQSVSLFSACTTKGVQGDAKASLGKFMVTTNVWNPRAASEYHECVNAKYNNVTGLTDAKITWDVTNTANQVLAYPNLAHGWQVGTDQGTTSHKLPMLVSNASDIIASGQIETVCAPGAVCFNNTAFELLFSKTINPSVWPPSAELMVWLQATCGACNAGKLQGKVTIDGVVFDVYKGDVTPPGSPTSWTYIAYVAQNTVTQFNFNFKNFLKDANDRGYLKASDHLAVIELGTEIVTGKGSTTITGYSIR